MRVTLAALFVIICQSIVVAIVFSLYPGQHLPWFFGPILVAIFFVLLIIGSTIFNVGQTHLFDVPKEEFIKGLEKKGLLDQQDFQAIRAFTIEEYEDEGTHYMIELRDGSVLYLSGQYLYDYEPIDDDPDLNQPRGFPCTDFTIKRHREEGYVVEIVRRGEVLEPECRAPSFDWKDLKNGTVPEDGQIFSDKSYEDLKRERMKS